MGEHPVEHLQTKSILWGIEIIKERLSGLLTRFLTSFQRQVHPTCSFAVRYWHSDTRLSWA